MKSIRTILIDPTIKSLATVTWNQKLDSLYALLRCQAVEAHDILSLGVPVTVWCDEEYWMRQSPQSDTYPATLFPMCAPIGGRILITGEADSEEGNILDCPIEVADLRDMIRFADVRHPWRA